MAAFPSLKPTRRNFSFGDYPIKTYRSLAGKTVRRIFGSRPYGLVLDLTFENINSTDLYSIFEHYHKQQGGAIGFSLSDTVLAGLPSSGDLFKQIKAGQPYIILEEQNITDGSTSDMEWLYTEAPQVESVYKDLSTVTVKLISEFKQ